MLFYVGIREMGGARHFERSFLSINALRRVAKPFPVQNWIMDSGAFTEISTYGHYRHDVAEYARDARRWVGCGNLELVVAQDWMCEPFITGKTGLSVLDHQRLTIERYDALLDQDIGKPIMPVLQGFAPIEYQRHIEAYGDRLTTGQRVGVGSVCKRNASVKSILEVLEAVISVRADLRLHGFGIKKTSLYNERIREILYSSDSMAWSYAARMEGRKPHDWREAKAYEQDVQEILAGRPQKRRGLGRNNPLRLAEERKSG